MPGQDLLRSTLHGLETQHCDYSGELIYCASLWREVLTRLHGLTYSQ